MIAALPVIGSGCSAATKTVALAPLSSAAPAAEMPSFPRTRLGAAAYVRAFLAEVNRAMTTGSTTRMLALGTAACGACQRMAGFIKDAHAHAQTIHGGRLTVRSAVASPAIGNRVRVTAIVDQSAERVVDARGHVTFHDGAAPRVDNEFELVWTNGWRVDRVTLFSA